MEAAIKGTATRSNEFGGRCVRRKNWQQTTALWVTVLQFLIQKKLKGLQHLMSHNHDFKLARERMVKDQLLARGIKDERVLQAMGKIPRHLFIEEALAGEAYNDHPVPIGEKQTISQPYIVALMTEALELKGKENTLEIGTGSGYQTAILAELSSRVYTIDRIKSLLVHARKLLAQLGYDNILFKAFDGTLGWKEYAPFDAIMVTAGSPHIPQPLIDQLADNGRLTIPVGDRYIQELIKVTKKGEGLKHENLGGCRFVNLIGVHGWSD